MQQMQRIRVDILTNGSGAFSTDTPEAFGIVRQVRYVPDGSNPLDTGADLTITGKTTGLVVANQTDIGTSAFTKTYRQATHGVSGAAALYASGGEAVLGDIVVWGEPLTVAIAQGGNAKQGTLYIWVG